MPFPLFARRPYVLLWLSLALLPFAGCHSADKAVELPAAPTAAISVQAEPAVSGDLSDFVEIVPGAYQVSVSKQDGDSYETTVKVKVRLVKATTIKAGQGYNNYGPELTARLLDASGAPIDGADNLFTAASFDGNLAPLLKQGKGEEWLTFHVTQPFSGYSQESKAALPAKAAQFLAALQGAKKISLTSKIVAEKFEDKASAGAASAAAVTGRDSDDGDSSSDCDAFLEGYGEYVEEYVALAKEMQANPSDAALLAKSSALSLKATQWASKAKGCENDPDFQAKYTALSTKMAMGMAQ